MNKSIISITENQTEYIYTYSHVIQVMCISKISFFVGVFGTLFLKFKNITGAVSQTPAKTYVFGSTYPSVSVLHVINVLYICASNHVNTCRYLHRRYARYCVSKGNVKFLCFTAVIMIIMNIFHCVCILWFAHQY